MVACQGISESPSSQTGELFLPVNDQIAFVPADCVITDAGCPTPTKVQFISQPHFTRISDWSSDSSKALAFAQDSASAKTDLFILKPHDYSPQLLASMAYIEDAHWSPDGKWIAVIGVKDGDPKTAGSTDNQIQSSRLYLYSADGSEVQDLTGNLMGQKHDLSWLDQNSILLEVYTSFENCGLYKINIITNEQSRLTESPACWIWPVAAPDGTRIAFVDNDNANGSKRKVFTMAPDGSDIQPVVELQGLAVYPRWSTDSKWITLRTVEDHLGGAIYLVHPNGTNMQKIYQEPALIYDTVLPPSSGEKLLVKVVNNFSGETEKWMLISIPDGKSHEIQLSGFDATNQPEWLSWRPAQSIR